MRWIKWVVICHFGRRCGYVVSEPFEPLPSGLRLQITYTCGGCGTEYISDGTDRRRWKP